jgi:hypothetical protein
MTPAARCLRRLHVAALWLLLPSVVAAAEQPVVGLIPKAHQPIKMDGTLDGWDGAFVTPVHVGHPDYANRGGQFLFLWDDDSLYIGQRCLDRHMAHVGPDTQLWNGDAVEFYLDTRRGEQLGAKEFGPGTLHMFYTPFTGSEVKPRLAVRDLPAFRDFHLKGAQVAGRKTRWGYTAVLKLPWANFPNFKAKAGEVLGIDCELCSSDGGLRVDRTFVYSGPASVSTPAAFGRVRLVDEIDPAKLQPFGRVLLPLAVTTSKNYPHWYGTVCLSPTILKDVHKLEGRILDDRGTEKLKTDGSRRTLPGSGFVLWSGAWEMYDLPRGTYTVELRALDASNRLITSRAVRVLRE